MITINVQGDIDQALRKIHAISEQAVGKAVVRSLNKVAAQAKVQAARQIRDTGYGLQIGKIKSAIRIVKADRRELTAKVIATGRPLPLINYGARQRSAGVSVAVKEGRKVIKGAFIATMPTGHKGVYVRQPGAKHKLVRGVQHALPIRELFGPSIPAAFSNQVVQRALEEDVRKRFPVVFKQELKYALQK